MKTFLFLNGTLRRVGDDDLLLFVEEEGGESDTVTYMFTWNNRNKQTVICAAVVYEMIVLILQFAGNYGNVGVGSKGGECEYGYDQ
jgi:hypothetical protein